MMKRILILLLIFFCIPIVSGLNADSYDVEIALDGSKAIVDVDIKMSSGEAGEFEYILPYDARGIDLSVNGVSLPLDIEEDTTTLLIPYDASDSISISYLSRDLLDNDNLLMDMEFSLNIEKFSIMVVLPEDAKLKKPIRSADLKSGSIYPKPTDMTTDGRALIFIWERENVKAGDEIALFIQIEKKSNLWLLFLTLMIIGGVVYYFIHQDKKVDVEDYDSKHLKPEEEEIVNILKQKEGSCEQGTLRVITGHSKATLSRLLTELEGRKFVHKEKRGKKNLIFLK